MIHFGCRFWIEIRTRACNIQYYVSYFWKFHASKHNFTNNWLVQGWFLVTVRLAAAVPFISLSGTQRACRNGGVLVVYLLLLCYWLHAKFSSLVFMVYWTHSFFCQAKKKLFLPFFKESSRGEKSLDCREFSAEYIVRLDVCINDTVSTQDHTLTHGKDERVLIIHMLVPKVFFG